jgi:hypothetical protein
MPELRREAVERYLQNLLKQPVKVLSLGRLGQEERTGDLKAYGYGEPVRVTYEAEGETHSVVLETVSPGPFGHEHRSDRAQGLLWCYDTFNALPRHARALDVGAFLPEGELLSLGKAGEFFLLTEFVQGSGYYQDLDRIRLGGELRPLDLDRVRALADYIAEIHSVKGEDPGLYVRKVRDLVGHGECIMGLTDSYPLPYAFITANLLERIEKACVAWRWKLKGKTHRLRRVHGDFHPWNILFREGTDFTVLDRARGEWGEPADDPTCLSINFLLGALLREGKMAGPFETLLTAFWDRYLDRTGDREVLEAAAPFLAFRGLVVASPVWYPQLPEAIRRKLFAFIEGVLASDRFDYRNVNHYLSEGLAPSP